MLYNEPEKPFSTKNKKIKYIRHPPKKKPMQTPKNLNDLKNLKKELAPKASHKSQNLTNLADLYAAKHVAASKLPLKK